MDQEGIKVYRSNSVSNACYNRSYSHILKEKQKKENTATPQDTGAFKMALENASLKYKQPDKNISNSIIDIRI